MLQKAETNEDVNFGSLFKKFTIANEPPLISLIQHFLSTFTSACQG